MQQLTGEQLERIKKQAYDQGYNTALKNVWGEVEKEWDSRQKQFMSGGYSENLYRTFVLLIALPCTVLIEDFGWKPPKDPRTGKDRKQMERTKLHRFLQIVMSMLEVIGSDEMMDIRKYEQDFTARYGIDLSIFDEVFLSKNNKTEEESNENQNAAG